MTRAIFILCLNSSLHVSRYPDLSARCVSESIYLKRSYVNPSFVMTRVGVSKDRDPEAKSARIPKVSHRERQEDGVGESTEPVVDGEASGGVSADPASEEKARCRRRLFAKWAANVCSETIPIGERWGKFDRGFVADSG